MPGQPDQPDQPDQRGPVLFLVLLAMVALVVVAWGAGREQPTPSYLGSVEPTSPAPTGPSALATPRPDAAPEPGPGAPATLPGGRTHVFGGHRFLVAYYGTAQTASMGVLGETDPDTMDRRLSRAAAPFRRPGQPVQHVYELIVTVADRNPGKDGDFSHDISRKQVRPYLRAAHRNNTLLLLDIQPGHTDFLTVAKRWRWALQDPWVGLALDPEWRMSGHDVPGHVIGHVKAGEVNRTSAWLSRLVERDHLPQKLFVLHQFRTAMIQHIGRVKARPALAMVQHVDGFGTPGEKKQTFHAVVRPKKFVLGFKLFYQVDIHRMSARQVFKLRPKVRFVSFQ